MKNLILLFAIVLFAACTSQKPKEVSSTNSPELKTTLTKSSLKTKLKVAGLGRLLAVLLGVPPSSNLMEP